MKILAQDHVLRYLSQGLATGRLSPSLLFVGGDGVGKRTVALDFSEKLVTRDGVIHRGEILFVDKAMQATLLREKPETQNAVKIETVRHIDKFLHLKPGHGGARVAIIDDAHKLTTEAANALLKLLEEPPKDTMIILLCRDEKRLPGTVLSRCAVLRFRPIPAKDITIWLAENKTVPLDEAAPIARQAAGSLSRAIALAEKDTEPLELAKMDFDEFSALLSEPGFRREARGQAEKAIAELTDTAQRRLEEGDLSQIESLRLLLRARRQLDSHVSPRLLLENVFLKLRPVFKN